MRRLNARPPATDPEPPIKMDASLNLHLQLRPPPSSRLPPLKTSLTAVAAAALLLCLLIASRAAPPLTFAIVIDGGSTGTRIHVFGYRMARSGLPVVDSAATAAMKVSPGLSAFVVDPRGAGESLVELVEFAKGVVPREQWGETEVRLMGTAGLRMVEAGVVARILESCREVLRGSGFRFQDDWAMVISGADEGIYAWVAANYALGTLGGDPHKTSGIFELGGASAQVTFFSSESLPPDFSHVVKFGEITYSLYSHSFLHLGQNVAYESLRELLSSRDPKTSADSVQGRIFKDPCTPKGYVHHVESLEPSLVALHSDAEYHPIAHAIGNFSECRSAALMLLQKGKDECLHPHCPLGPTFIPKLQGRFLATENFFYTSKFFGLGSTSFLRDLMSTGEQFCEEDWSTLKKKYHNLDDDDLVRYCFSSAYIVALLHDSLGVAVDDNRIEFAHQVGGVALDWALGAFIIQKTSVQISRQSYWITSIVKGDSSAVVSLLSISALLIFIAWSLRKWRKPQSKTIFDLEKGRYITVHYRT